MEIPEAGHVDVPPAAAGPPALGRREDAIAASTPMHPQRTPLEKRSSDHERRGHDGDDQRGPQGAAAVRKRLADAACPLEVELNLARAAVGRRDLELERPVLDRGLLIRNSTIEPWIGPLAAADSGSGTTPPLVT